MIQDKESTCVLFLFIDEGHLVSLKVQTIKHIHKILKLVYIGVLWDEKCLDDI